MSRDLHRRSRRLGLQTGVLIVALLAVVGLLAFVLYERTEHRAAYATLRLAATDAVDGALPPDLLGVVDGPGGRTASTPLPAGLPVEADLARVAADGRARQQEVSVGGRDYFVRTQRTGDTVVQVALDRTAAETASRRILEALLLAGGVGVLLAAAAAAMLARRAFQPVTEALELQRRFVSDASHELRTPLTLLSTRVQLLARRLDRDPRLAPELRDDLEGVVADTRALTGLLDELLLSAEPHGGAAQVDCDLAALVTSVVASAQASAETRGVRIVAGDLAAVTVPASPPAVRRAVTSLADNALDHARCLVRIDLVADRRHVQVVVTDDGPGVPDDVADRVFDRFSSTRTGLPGRAGGRRHYGLGLSLVADVAAAHGGAWALRRRADGAEGSVFVLTLPR